MARVEAIGHRLIERRGTNVANRSRAAVRSTLKTTTQLFGEIVTIDDLGTIVGTWTRHVDDLMIYIADAFETGAGLTYNQLQRETRRVVDERSRSAAGTSVFNILKIQSKHAETLLASARNRLVNVGNDVWEYARDALLIGLQAGEGTASLTARVMAVANVASWRAEVISRTEVGRAMNQGSLEQMRQIAVPTMTREWIAVEDARTRPEHAEVNGERVRLDESFSLGEDPGDAPCCRCTQGYDMPDDDFATATIDDE